MAEDDPVQAAFHALVADAPSPTQTVTRAPGSSSPAASLRSPGGWKRTLARRVLLVVRWGSRGERP